ncbi:MAG TPA: hypothetical protein VE959_12420 [Bryobacteraceae bacterium]|nr:hypothetical protein [Bryobacteraceae bacterium]
MKRCLLVALVSTSCMLPLQCATLERLSLNDMISQSTSVVRGTVTGSYAAFSGPVIYTHYTIQVSERLKGAAGAAGAGSTVDVVVPGGTVANLRQSFAGTPTFLPGDEYVFFLWTSRAGLTQVMGLTQGLFSVAEDGTADPLATRSASHELMLDQKTGRPVKDQTLTMRLSDLRSRIAGAK